MYKKNHLSIAFFIFIILFVTNTTICSAQISDFFSKNQTLNSNIETALLHFIEEYEKRPVNIQKYAAQRNIKIEEKDKVTVLIFFDTHNSIDPQYLKAYGAEIIKGFDNVLKVRVPVKNLKSLADNIREISFIKLPDTFVPSVLSEGVQLTGAATQHTSGNTGSGVKAAVIDSGFDNLSSAVFSGELPDDATFIDCTGSSCSSTAFSFETSPHGTAVAEIIHDMAPGAQLYLIKINDTLDLVQAKNYCISNGISIINLSGGWFNTNFYDGACYNSNPVCTANDAYSNGILWVNSAGNEAGSHYEATFQDSDADTLHDQLISLFAYAEELIDIYLTWDAWPATDQDYDIGLFYPGLDILIDSGIDAQTGTQPPSEIIFTTAPFTGYYDIKIQNYSTTSDHQLEIYSSHDLSPSIASSSLLSPADASGALAVGAIDFLNWTTGPQEYYSSQGPTNDGRLKPEIMGPDYVSTLTYDFEGFPGTSAASPHVAGAAALILSQNPQFSASDVRDVLTNSAIDMGSPGQDNIFGFGRLHLPTETVSTPAVPSGPASGDTGTSYNYSTSGSSSSSGHPVEYQFDWNGDRTDLSPWGSSTQSKTWITTGTFNVRVRARCTLHQNIVSNWSDPLLVTITAKGPDIIGAWTYLDQTCKTTKKGTKCKIKGVLNIQNTGNENASSSNIRFYLSDNELYDAQDVILKQTSTGKMKIGKIKNKKLKYKFPLDESASGKFIIAVTDADETLQEINESNNNAVFGPVP